MEPPRRPGRDDDGDDDSRKAHWVDPGYCKYSPGTAPTPDPSKITRTYPEPALLVERRKAAAAAAAAAKAAAEEGGGDGGSSSSGGGNPSSVKRRKDGEGDGDMLEEEDEGDEDDGSDMDLCESDDELATIPRRERTNPFSEETEKDLAARKAMLAQGRCLVCHDSLPDEGRGFIKCNHVFCIGCIHDWSKKESSCPVCRVEFSCIIKTLSQADMEALNARKTYNEADATKAFKKRMRSKSGRCKMPKRFVVTKTIKVKRKSQKETNRRLEAQARHPQAPGGSMYGAFDEEDLLGEEELSQLILAGGANHVPSVEGQAQAQAQAEARETTAAAAAPAPGSAAVWAAAVAAAAVPAAGRAVRARAFPFFSPPEMPAAAASAPAASGASGGDFGGGGGGAAGGAGVVGGGTTSTVMPARGNNNSGNSSDNDVDVGEEGDDGGLIRNQDFDLPGMFLPGLQGVGDRAAGGGTGRLAVSRYRFGVAGGPELGGSSDTSSSGSSGSGSVGAAAGTSEPASSPSAPPAAALGNIASNGSTNNGGRRDDNADRIGVVSPPAVPPSNTGGGDNAMGGRSTTSFAPIPPLSTSPRAAAPSPVAVSPPTTPASEAPQSPAAGASAATALSAGPLRRGPVAGPSQAAVSPSTAPAAEAAQGLAAGASREANSGFQADATAARPFLVGPTRQGTAAAATVVQEEQAVRINDDGGGGNGSGGSGDGGGGGSSSASSGLVHDHPETEENPRDLKRARR